MVNLFMDHLMALKNIYERSLPEELTNQYKLVKEKIGSCGDWHEQRKLYGEKAKLQTLMSLPIFGFNSSKFDLKVLVPYMVKYANNNDLAKEVRVLKKGSNYFSFSIDTLDFKDVLSFSAPCSLDKYFKQWYKGDLAKGIYPYQKFSSIEQINAQVDFPSYDEFYSELKSSNIERVQYESSREEYYRRFNLPESHPEKMYNFGCWLKHYQMLDVVPLVQAIKNSFTAFYQNFGIYPMEKKSLPSIAYTAAFNLCDQSLPRIFTFSPKFDSERQLFRAISCFVQSVGRTRKPISSDG